MQVQDYIDNLSEMKEDEFKIIEEIKKLALAYAEIFNKNTKIEINTCPAGKKTEVKITQVY